MDIIKKFREVHGNKYDYTKVQYVNKITKVRIICPKHGEFKMEPFRHLKGVDCRECGILKRAASKRLTPEKILERFNKKWLSRYDYSKADLTKGVRNKITIICKKHGEFKLSVMEHFVRGCKKCSGEVKSRLQLQTLRHFIEVSNARHDYKYSYKNSEYKGVHYPITVTCPIHGDFTCKAGNHMNGSGCPKCKSSKGELAVRMYLKNKKINFKEQYCLTSERLPYDFYLPDYDVLIEYDGRQHFDPVNSWGGANGFKRRKLLDARKDLLAIKNDMILIRVPYTELKNIDSYLDSKLSNIVARNDSNIVGNSHLLIAEKSLEP